jgi:hypothetical protein
MQIAGVVNQINKMDLVIGEYHIHVILLTLFVILFIIVQTLYRHKIYNNLHVLFNPANVPQMLMRNFL